MRPDARVDEDRVREIATTPIQPDRPFNDLAEIAGDLHPALADLRSSLGEAIGGPMHVSGSGSTLFALVDDEVTARLVEERGASEVARSRRVPLLEDVDLMHATRAEIDEIERVLVVMAHPDDVDFGAAGTVANLTDAGVEVRFLEMMKIGVAIDQSDALFISADDMLARLSGWTRTHEVRPADSTSSFT